MTTLIKAMCLAGFAIHAIESCLKHILGGQSVATTGKDKHE